ncbi:hypothetical protein HMPREF0491_03001 [Lachnospiraceae oral taxon 107 str. F0167]|nr:hypothetical protein HMPREF0491_03001 [Lachnospiraceae oral taxon 107 str. F0167]
MIIFEEIDVKNSEPIVTNGDIIPYGGFACGVACTNGMACGVGCGHNVGTCCGAGCAKG